MEADGKSPDTRHPKSRGTPVLRSSLATEGGRRTYWYAAVTRMRITQPFGFAQGRESLDVARDRELAERHVER